MNDRTTCGICGEEHPTHTLIHVSGVPVCPNCLDQTVLCTECGQRIFRSENTGSDGHPLCPACFDTLYLSCARCGALVRQNHACYLESDGDEEFPYCPDCYYHLDSEPIKDYGYKPESIFYGEGPRYFGVELEIDEGGESRSNAISLLDLANREETRLYCKHDGSLEDGLELVSHPMSLDYHRTRMPWEAVMREALQMGYRAHQANTCGLHVHVSRAAFGKTEQEQDEAIARVLYFFEKHWEELLKFSRRTYRQLERWANRYGFKERPRDILDHAKKGYHAGRYVCVNILNPDTVEFRIFRGTLKYNTLMATLQLLDRVCDVAIFMSDEELKAMPWTTFVSGCTQPELVQYLKERRLYVNDPVESEVEV